MADLIGKRKKYRMRIRGYFECEAISKGEAMDIFEAIIPEHDFVYYIDEKILNDSTDDYTDDYEIITEKDWFGDGEEDDVVEENMSLTICPKNMCNITIKICEGCDYFDGIDKCEFSNVNDDE